MEILPPWLASQARPVLTGRFHPAEDVLRTMLVYFVYLPETYGPLFAFPGRSKTPDSGSE